MTAPHAEFVDDDREVLGDGTTVILLCDASGTPWRRITVDHDGPVNIVRTEDGKDNVIRVRIVTSVTDRQTLT